MVAAKDDDAGQKIPESHQFPEYGQYFLPVSLCNQVPDPGRDAVHGSGEQPRNAGGDESIVAVIGNHGKRIEGKDENLVALH